MSWAKLCCSTSELMKLTSALKAYVEKKDCAESFCKIIRRCPANNPTHVAEKSKSFTRVLPTWHTGHFFPQHWFEHKSKNILCPAGINLWWIKERRKNNCVSQVNSSVRENTPHSCKQAEAQKCCILVYSGHRWRGTNIIEISRTILFSVHAEKVGDWQ